MVSERELEDLRYEHKRASLQRDSLQKNYDRRKKLKLSDDTYERDILHDIAIMDDQLRELNKKIRSIESEQERSKIISESRTGNNVQFK